MASEEKEFFKQKIGYEGEDPLRVYKAGKIKSLLSSFGDFGEEYTFKQQSPTDFWFKIKLKSTTDLSNEDICMKEIKAEISVEMEGKLKRQSKQQGPPLETGNIQVEIKGKFKYVRKEFEDYDRDTVRNTFEKVGHSIKHGIYDACVLNPLMDKYKKIIRNHCREIYDEIKATFDLQKIE